MISLCTDEQALRSALDANIGSECIRHTIRLYLDSYGTAYDFAQFYIQRDVSADTVMAIILRYNQTLYCVAENNADFSELSVFVRRFSDVTAVCDISVYKNCADIIDGEICAVMSKKGEAAPSLCENVCICEDAKPVSELVTESMIESKRTDFFLNTSHQLRHGNIKVYAYIIDSKPVSVASVTCGYNSISVIPFVYTGEYFRGNGYSHKVLSSLCNDINQNYQLLCEEHNKEFYKKCGFTQIGSWVRYRL